MDQIGAKSSNHRMNKAKSQKQDEFYTQLNYIEEELSHYTDHLKDKIVYCPCDDATKSKFYKYFKDNFNRLGLKQLQATCIANNKLYIYNGKTEEINELTTNGDFQTQEIKELIKQSDIVVTNPPFSLFRVFIKTLIESNVKFLIIGNYYAISYPEILPYLVEGKAWLGYHFGNMAFKVPADYEPHKHRYWQDETGQKWRSIGNICWFTNMDIPIRHKSFFKEYKPPFKKSVFPVCYKGNEENYKFFDERPDILNCDTTRDIPIDYTGLLGVPVSYMKYYNPSEFKLIGKLDTGKITKYNLAKPTVDGKEKYTRLVIKRNGYLS